MKITVCDRNPALAEAWPTTAGIEVVTGSILDIECDAVVSPANSFGFMDGGVDYAYSEYFGWHVQEMLQAMVGQQPFGELLVGQALLVRTGKAEIPYLISAPTMRVPKRITDPADVFLACRAATAQAIKTGLQHIAFPGMGTGCGDLPFDIAARAMRGGILAAQNPIERPTSWRMAQQRHFELQG